MRYRNADRMTSRCSWGWRGLRRLGRLDEAKRRLDTILAKQPQRGDALTERGGLALDEGDAAGAEVWLRRAVERRSYDQTATNQLREALRCQGKHTEAKGYEARLKEIDATLKRLHQISKAVMVSPNDAELRCEGGLLFLRTGEEAEGLRWLRLAVQLNPGCRAARVALEEHARATPRRAPPPPEAGRQGRKNPQR